MFCPNCGKELPQIKYREADKHLPPDAEVICQSCGCNIVVVDRSSQDQEGFTEIIIH